MDLHPLLRFVVDHPFVSFFMAWPVALTLVSVCWSITNMVTSMAGSVVNLAIGLAYQATVMIRGFPPVQPLGPDDDDLDDDDPPPTL